MHGTHGCGEREGKIFGISPCSRHLNARAGDKWVTGNLYLIVDCKIPTLSAILWSQWVINRTRN